MLLPIAKQFRPGWSANYVQGRRVLLALVLACTSVSAAENWIKYDAYPTPTTNQYTALTRGPNGLLWFIDRDGNSLGSITTDGVITEYLIPWTHYPNDLVLGSDGALWFTESLVGIGRFAPGSGFTEYAMPASATLDDGSVSLGAITAGPDGALWFAQSGGCTSTCIASHIGSITTTGVITLFPYSGGYQWDIVAGPDGALWFTESDPANKIARFTTGGVLTEYSLPNLYSNPASITVGPDGALWFLEVGVYNHFQSGGRVGRITTDGALSEFTVPLPSRFKLVSGSSLVAGADGALWFFLSDYNPPDNLWPMTTNGTFTGYSGIDLGFGELDSGTVGSDGALWFTGYQQIVRLPACGLGLSASFANATLTLNFNGGAPTPTIWQTGFYYGTGSFQALWSVPLGPVAHSTPITVPLGPGFPSIGTVAPISVLRDAATNDGLCAEWEIVNTGGSGGVIEEEVQGPILKQLKE